MQVQVFSVTNGVHVAVLERPRPDSDRWVVRLDGAEKGSVQMGISVAIGMAFLADGIAIWSGTRVAWARVDDERLREAACPVEILTVRSWGEHLLVIDELTVRLWDGEGLELARADHDEVIIELRIDESRSWLRDLRNREYTVERSGEHGLQLRALSG